MDGHFRNQKDWKQSGSNIVEMFQKVGDVAYQDDADDYEPKVGDKVEIYERTLNVPTYVGDRSVTEFYGTIKDKNGDQYEILIEDPWDKEHLITLTKDQFHKAT